MEARLTAMQRQELAESHPCPCAATVTLKGHTKEECCGVVDFHLVHEHNVPYQFAQCHQPANTNHQHTTINGSRMFGAAHNGVCPRIPVNTGEKES